MCKYKKSLALKNVEINVQNNNEKEDHLNFRKCAK